jgi:hypothetical protein
MKLTRRGYIVLTIFLILIVVGAVEIATHLWWSSTGYCWGNANQCLEGL